MCKKYFFFDIDGTLTKPNSEIISEDTIKTLHKLKENGHFVAIATGRPAFLAKEFAKRAGIHNYVCNGGNTLIIEDECRKDNALDCNESTSLMQYLMKHDIPFMISCEDSFDVLTHSEEAIHLFEKIFSQIMIERIDATEMMKQDHIKRIFIHMNTSDEKRIQQFNHMILSRYHKDIVIVEADNKYQGICELMQIIHGDINDVVVFGDGSNDIKMFQNAPFCIAMGNAITELKEIADFTSDRSDDDGITSACKKFGWI